MQTEFKPLVEAAAALCKNYFAERLLALYLHGSIAAGDAVPYVSDLDCYIVISQDLTEKDEKYLEQAENELQRQYPLVDGIHLSVRSIKELEKDKFARFVLKYNAMLYLGSDIAKQLDESGCERFEPDTAMAKGRLAFARQCFEQALNQEQPACTGEVPEDAFYASRKYARYFVIIEGAYFLMSQKKFQSFAKEDVLSKLYQYTNGFEEELDMTRDILDDPRKAGITQEEFLRRIRPFVMWMFDKIEEA